MNYWDDQMGEVMGEAMSRPFDHASRTQDLRHLGRVLADTPRRRRRQGLQRRHQVRRVAEPPTLEWSNSVLIEGDAAEGLAALKKEDGPELQVHGSGNLIQTLLRHNLVDEYRLWVFPVVIGSGKRLFADGTIPAGLKLVDSKVSTTGVVIGTYEPAGEIPIGSFG